MKRYYAKPDTWFKEGTEAFREEEMCPHGSLTDGKTGEKTGSAVYRGIYVIGSGGSYLMKDIKKGKKLRCMNIVQTMSFLW